MRMPHHEEQKSKHEETVATLEKAARYLEDCMAERPEMMLAQMSCDDASHALHRPEFLLGRLAL